MTHIFKSPKFYKELRMQYGPDKAISNSEENSEAASVRRGSRPKHQAASLKPQATETQASSGKHQAPSCKPQASSREQQAAQSRYPHKVSSN